ncbi:MAG TPA: AsmA-like C-terminal region-containing protein [Chitinophagaceae bacterium]|nr:AsmA-like C-terminal region-containing protein [Chitinophagaceae bacterium]
MKKTLRKTAKITGIILLVLIAAAFLIPIFFKKQITGLVKNEINKSLVAKVDFKDVSLSLFRHFPKISISLDELSVVGTNEFAKDTLISAKTFDASVNLISAIKGKDIKVYGVFLESPRIHALMNKDGKANWDIARPDNDTTGSPDTSPSEFKMSLQHYEIKNGYLYYKDETADMSTEIVDFDHEGSGDFTADVFTLKTKTKAENAGFIYTSIPYLNNAKAVINGDIQIDNTNSKYSFKTDEVKLNNLNLNAEGFFQLVNDSTYNMDIKFKTPSNEFKDILSLIPGIYKKDFDKIKTSGQAAFNGFVKGTYSPQQMPAYDVNLDVTNGFFQYPDLPKPVKNIQLAIHASNPDGKPDNAVIDISKGHLEMDNEPFDFKLLFKNPETAKYIDAIAKGKLDLANIGKLVKLPGDTKLAGLVWADVFAKGNMEALQVQQGNFTAGGFLDIKNLFYSSKDVPQPIQNGNMKVSIENSGGIADNTNVNITDAHIEVGKDPVDFSLKLQHPMSSVDFSGTAKGRFTLDNIKQFTVLEPGTSIAGLLNADLGFSGNKTAIDKGEYDKIAINGNAALNNLKYVSKDYPTGITVSNTELGFAQKTVTLKDLNGNYLNTNFSGNGVLNNLVGFAMQDQPLTGTINISADKMNLNDWMGTDTSTTSSTTSSSSSSKPFAVPANINLTVNAKAGNVKYDKVDYKNINGTLLLADETVKLQNVKTDALDGTMTLNGSYSTKTNKKDPAININYEVKDVSVQKAFYAFNTVQKLMPIGQFLDGKLHSQLSMTGNLLGNMMPDLSTLTGKGNLLLVEGLLKKFAPLEQLANALQIDHLKSISLKDVKQYIEFANGKVLVKPFNLKVQDIDMQIGGMHGFDQSMDYIIEMKVPRKYLGNQGNDLVNGLVAQATNKGIPVKLSDMVDLSVKMGGSITKPSLKIDLQKVVGNATDQLKEQAKDFAQQKIDSAKARAKDSLTVIKNNVKEEVKEKLLEQVFGKDTTKTNNFADTSKKKADPLKDKLKNMFIKPKKPAADTTKKG